jgi:TonB family protein
MRATLGVVAVVGSVVTWACASAGGRAAGSCTSELARDGRSLNEVVDSAPLSKVLPGFWDSSAGLTLAMVRRDSTGVVDTVAVISASASEPVRRHLESTLRMYATPHGEPKNVASIFLGDSAGPRPRRVHEFRMCGPVLQRDQILKAMQDEAELLRSTLGPKATVSLMAFVQPDGHVGEVRVARRSSNIEVDEAAVRVMKTAVFRPALLEGIPVPMWASVPVTFQLSH